MKEKRFLSVFYEFPPQQISLTDFLSWRRLTVIPRLHHFCLLHLSLSLLQQTELTEAMQSNLRPYHNNLCREMSVSGTTQQL